MDTQLQPPTIHFYEEASLNTVQTGRSGLTKTVRLLSLGLIKTDTQAGLVIIIIMVASLFCAYVFVGSLKAVEPTTYYEIIPQESIGSVQGLPVKTDNYDQ
jgi:hypothetical protein